MNNDPFIDQLVTHLKPVAPPRRWTTLLLRLSFLNILSAAGVLVLHGIRPEFGLLWGRATFLIECTALLLCIGLSFASAQASAMPGQLQGAKSKARLFSALILLFSMSLAVHGGWNVSEHGLNAFVGGMTCSIMIAFSSVLPLLWGWRELRRGAPTEPRLAGFFLSGAVVTAAVFVQHLICPVDNAPHLLVWHTLPLILIMAIVYRVAPKLFRW